MANSEQEDILDGLVHIYECDEQHVSALIIPTDGEIREDLPVYIEDAESDTIYATTTTDTYGMINTTFSLSPGTHTPTIKCGSNKHNIYDTSVVCHACSLTLTSDKDILSATDGDIATLTATLIGTESGYNGPLSGREVAFEIYQASDDTFIETLTATTNSSGVATVSYSSQGIGDISIVAKVGSLVSETYDIIDAWNYDPNTYSSSRTGLDIGLPTGNFEISFKAKPTSRSGSYCALNIGTDSNHRVYFGQGNPNGNCTLYIKNSTSGPLYNQSTSGVTTLNEWNLITLQYVDGLWKLLFNNESLSYSYSSVPHTKIFSNDCTSNNIKDLIIKSL